MAQGRRGQLLLVTREIVRVFSRSLRFTYSERLAA
jgi:hypothetical protein